MNEDRYLYFENGRWFYYSKVFTASVDASDRGPNEDWLFVFPPEVTNTEILKEFSRFLKEVRMAPVRRKVKKTV